ncbi:hypothetical protein QA645_17020 [Bradyrhizobium sp. CIAT3101]|uniref:hypothetical protein n=1 Tax=Bradyrhizobium sp. CIAT3101 TaxID=439387 RepID=UPI0024B052A0|nr:hypothetical protein [Bradyrhizobium sp. CIAT3101]WFU84374.1 hypothetical protein QA645_17020 [Bradyrhizobium sp. CIAT3101]
MTALNTIERDLKLRALASATWREDRASKYSEDARNGEAANQLRELSAQIALSDADVQLLEPYYGGGIWRDAVTLTNRQVGFHRRLYDCSDYIAFLLENLEKGGAH